MRSQFPDEHQVSLSNDCQRPVVDILCWRPLGVDLRRGNSLFPEVRAAAPQAPHSAVPLQFLCSVLWRNLGWKRWISRELYPSWTRTVPGPQWSRIRRQSCWSWQQTATTRWSCFLTTKHNINKTTEEPVSMLRECCGYIFQPRPRVESCTTRTFSGDFLQHRMEYVDIAFW